MSNSARKPRSKLAVASEIMDCSYYFCPWR